MEVSTKSLSGELGYENLQIEEEKKKVTTALAYCVQRPELVSIML